MLAAQSTLRLVNEALRLAKPTESPTDQESSIVPCRAIEGLEKLAGIATLGETHAQQSGSIFKDVAQDLHGSPPILYAVLTLLKMWIMDSDGVGYLCSYGRDTGCIRQAKSVIPSLWAGRQLLTNTPRLGTSELNPRNLTQKPAPHTKWQSSSPPTNAHPRRLYDASIFDVDT
ncbi:hypothetical protein M378DRAFT_18076 [Amanita muscaria Koide BX008]|uniref:Uncharacterized protein n=1 Tax=Amanita muscaria (strain Koide BX008) TaxID=946122 RepID=A0A0C2WGP0_AMAMK|nr:hypothetical protein M378DRAFT_18076 [Amanita muscaria Koide BX008]